MDRQAVKARFEQIFREYGGSNPGSLVREGSVVVDQVLNPLVMILAPLLDDVETLAQQNNPPGQAVTGDLLDAIGERYFVTRKSGTRSTADVRLLFSEKTDTRLPKGASVFAGDLEFQTTRDVRIAETHLSQVDRLGRTLYESPDIPVEAVEEGSTYEVAADAIRTPAFALPKLVGVYNPSASSSASTEESDEAFRSRIQSAIGSRSMDTTSGLFFLLGEEFGDDIKDTVLVHPGDPEMTRDLVRTYEDVTRIGFQNKTRGETQPNASRLLRRTTRTKKKAPDIFDAEVLQAGYNHVTSTDLDSLLVSADLLFQDTFDRDRTFQTQIGDGWIAGNTGEAWKDKDAASGIYINGGTLILGPRNLRQKEDSALPDPLEGFPGKTLPPMTLSVTEEDRERARVVDELLQQEGVSSSMRQEILDAILQPREYPTNGYRGIENNTSPVVQRKITQPYGFRITGAFSTTDPENPAAFTMARVENPDSASTVGRGPARFRWYEGYGFAVHAAEAGTQNLFIIDNAAAQRQMTVVGDEFVGSKMNFNTLSQTHVPIATETKYRYEMTVGVPATGDNAMTLTVRVWEDGQSRPSTPTLEYGAYVPENRRDELLTPGAEDITTTQTNPLDATHVGLGVSSTGGTEYWSFDEFTVENVQQSYAQVIAEIDVSEITTSSVEVDLVARAKGYDGAQEVYGHEVYAWNDTDGDWEDAALETVSHGSYAYRSTTTVVDLQDRVTDSDTLRLLITSTHPHEGPSPSPVVAALDVDYLSGQSYQGSTHTGGKSDLFVVQTTGTNERPSVTRTHTLSPASAINTLSPSDFGGPLEEILNVYVGSDTTGAVLASGQEYRYFWAPDGRRGSMDESVHLVVDPSVVGSSVTVEARVHNRVSSIHDFVRTSAQRKVDADLLARHKAAVWVDLDLNVTGQFSTSPDALVREWVQNRSDSHLDVATIGAYLLEHGADTVQTDAATLTTRWLDDHGNVQSTTAFSHTRSRTETFVPGTITVTVTG